MRFIKPPLPIEQQLNLVKVRSLQINDEEKAKFYLENIGYHRLSAYYRPFMELNTQDKDHIFKAETDFDDILELYIFDRQLRLIILDALERLEIAFRTKLSHTLSLKHGSHWYLKHGSHWYLKSDIFYNELEYAKLLTKIAVDLSHDKKGQKSSEAVKHYFKKYTNPTLPPSWVVVDELSFGTLSRIFKEIKKENRKEIFDLFNVAAEVLESWMHSLTILRNKYAHHARVWNSNFPAIKIPRSHPKLKIIHAQKLQGFICVIQYMLKIISGDSSWYERIMKHLKQNCPIDYKAPMGFIS